MAPSQEILNGVKPEPVPIEVQPHQLRHKVWPVAYTVDPNEKALLLKTTPMGVPV
jgi:hypothetical protein